MFAAARVVTPQVVVWSTNLCINSQSLHTLESIDNYKRERDSSTVVPNTMIVYSMKKTVATIDLDLMTYFPFHSSQQK
jgi:hypothetical protein